MERVRISFEDAMSMIPDGEYVHTFRSSPIALIGADWKRTEVEECIKKFGTELSGETATRMKHGLVSFDESGPVFFETKEILKDKSTTEGLGQELTEPVHESE